MLRRDRFSLRARPQDLDPETIREVNRLTQKCWTEGPTFHPFECASLLDEDLDAGFEDSRYMRSQISDRFINNALSLEDFA